MVALVSVFLTAIISIPTLLIYSHQIKSDKSHLSHDITPIISGEKSIFDANKVADRMICWIFGSKIFSLKALSRSIIISICVVLLFMFIGLIEDIFNSGVVVAIGKFIKNIMPFGFEKDFSEQGYAYFFYNNKFIVLISVVTSFIYMLKSRCIIRYIPHNGIISLVLLFILDIFTTLCVFILLESFVMTVSVLLSLPISGDNNHEPVNFYSLGCDAYHRCNTEKVSNVKIDSSGEIFISILQNIYYLLIRIINPNNTTPIPIGIGVFDYHQTENFCRSMFNKYVIDHPNLPAGTKLDCDLIDYSVVWYPLAAMIAVLFTSSLTTIWTIFCLISIILSRFIYLYSGIKAAIKHIYSPSTQFVRISIVLSCLMAIIITILFLFIIVLITVKTCIKL